MSRRNHTARRREGGFTLVELMIAVTMLGVVMYLTLDSLNRQQKTSIVTDQVVEVQNNSRAVASLLEREIRMAGFMVPDAAGVCGFDSTTAPDELFISETEPIVPDDERAGDLGGRFATTPSLPLTDTTYTLTTTDLDADGTFFYDNDGNGTPESDFRVGGGFIVADLANPVRGSVCGVVTSTTSTEVGIDVRQGSLVAFNSATHAPQELVIAPAAHYAVTTGGGQTRLVRNGDLLSNGVEDFQVSYWFDDGDDTIEAGEEFGLTTGAGVYDPGTVDNSTLREIRFAIVVRTRATDPDFTNGTFLNFGNRAAVAGNDNFRRRVIAGRVRPRNIGVEGGI